MARPPGRLWWRLSSDLLVGDTRSWPETSPGTIEVSMVLKNYHHVDAHKECSHDQIVIHNYNNIEASTKHGWVAPAH